ncbi:MAG: hypothetical protein JW834_00605 [Candidatus Diapherotrites archaeon]|nr:hypothetical protein [Candidatus Diapherotrites archaeon]
MHGPTSSQAYLKRTYQFEEALLTAVGSALRRMREVRFFDNTALERLGMMDDRLFSKQEADLEMGHPERMLTPDGFVLSRDMNVAVEAKTFIHPADKNLWTTFNRRLIVPARQFVGNQIHASSGSLQSILGGVPGQTQKTLLLTNAVPDGKAKRYAAANGVFIISVHELEKLADHILCDDLRTQELVRKELLRHKTSILAEFPELTASHFTPRIERKLSRSRRR